MNEEVMAQMGEHMKRGAEAGGTEPKEAPQLKFKPVEAGAATQVWAAVAPELAEHGGRYLADCQLAETGGNVADAGVESYALDKDDAARLWALSEELVGQKFDF